MTNVNPKVLVDRDDVEYVGLYDDVYSFLEHHEIFPINGEDGWMWEAYDDEFDDGKYWWKHGLTMDDYYDTIIKAFKANTKLNKLHIEVIHEELDDEYIIMIWDKEWWKNWSKTKNN